MQLSCDKELAAGKSVSLSAAFSNVAEVQVGQLAESGKNHSTLDCHIAPKPPHSAEDMKRR
jgi:hypothetical protein